MSDRPCLISGVMGAVALNVLHQSAKEWTALAPRMDVLGERALTKGLKKIDLKVPRKKDLFRWTLAGDVIANSLFYSVVGLGNPKHAVVRGAALGAAAGIGALLLPGPMGLGTKPAKRTRATAAMTMAWYSIGGVVAGMVAKKLKN